MSEIFVVAGARPNFMKVGPVLRAMRGEPRLEPVFVHTGQHYDPVLSEQIMRDLELPAPDLHLEVGSGTPSWQTARILEALEPILVERQPAALLVVGDVTSSLAAALTAANRDVPVVHVEAGLRSRDWSMPEERNRCLIDRLSRQLFVTEPAGLANLAAEGMDEGVSLVGNVMIDSLLTILPRARKSDVLERLAVKPPYAVLTVHRPGNTDAPERFEALLRAIEPLAARAPVVFPVHPRTRPILERVETPPGLMCVDPLAYLDFVGLVAQASLVLTDSGGIQEETTVLGLPCLTLRPNTERPITIEQGTNELVDLDAERIRELGLAALEGRWKSHSVPELWDGHTGERIVAALAEAWA